MREILFRGKRVDNGEWVEGYYGACDEYEDNGGAEHMYRETCTRLHYIIHESGKPSHMVYRDTVSQYTGLKSPVEDKIFEDDVCEFVYSIKYNNKGHNFIGKIEHLGCGYIIRDINDSSRCEHLNSGEAFIWKKGNIHDNPELLK